MSQFSRYAKFGVLPWLCLAPFQYGFAISELNQLQKAVSCKGSALGDYGFPLCVPMDDTAFSLVTSAFLVGGLTASLFANRLTDPYGRKMTVQISAVFSGVGSALLATALSVTMLVIGRFMIGVGAGLALCVIPPFLSEISPPKIRGAVGILNQLSVVIGILVTQVLGFFCARPGSWRKVFIFSTVLAVLQVLFGARMIESPAWLAAHNKKPEARSVSAKLWVRDDGEGLPSGRGLYDDDDVEEALLRQTEPLPNQDQPPATIGQCFRTPELRRPLFIVSLAMLAQQLSGINAVMYYSTGILSKALPDAASYVSLGVTVVNVIMTFPPIFVLERYGQRKILQYSVGGSIISLLILGLALNYNVTVAAAIGTLVFVSCFAFGLGPIPFIIIPDVSPLYAVSALSSIALSLNWLVNFIVGLTFLPLRNFLAGSDGEWAGNVFFLFTLLLIISSISFFRHF
ncbi:hypothetical protein M408DRAFT_63315 [Serendipita vermifera MAFF 305830]|uniref:Major facilitator superfamily (MFS) profile domain-containing protein n=1 Tax=Serendipita vermifera MAFF 305830 TaxID=933852 RepID=A0A0C3BLI3_SERVB|nr:hypothetical protein M408DRAFT_63315 [Serendipita vermifera MAFF 305830]